MKRLYTRDQYLERIAWMKAARRRISITTDVIVGFPGETEADFEESIALIQQVEYDAIFSFKYSPRPNTPALTYIDSVPEEEKTLRLAVLNARQKEISLAANQRHLGEALEVMVEGRNPARSQWIGRTSQHKVLNFTTGGGEEPRVGQYVPVRVTATFPNSLLGEMA